MSRRAQGRPEPLAAEFAEVEPVVTITLPKLLAEAISLGMADLLCWVQGFKAACPEDHDRHPMGVERTRDMRTKLLRAIERAESEQEKETAS